MRTLQQVFLATAILATSSVALAEEPKLLTPYGMSVHAGGGVGGFVDESMRDLTGTAGNWEARLTFGTRLPLAIEAAYLGGAQTITELGLDEDAYLLTTGVEGTARVNLLTEGAFQPYVFIGMGWIRYDLTNYDTNTSSIEDSDDVLIIPFGVGIAYRYRFLIADVRGQVRPATGEDMVPLGNEDGDHDNMDTWSATAHVGFEF